MPKLLTIAVENEPQFLMPGLGDTSANKAANNLRLALSQRLATYDDRGDLLPMLATELPSQERGTWVVRPDGTMQTLYRLRPGITWHDGTPLTGGDFAFAWTVRRDPNLDRTVPALVRIIERFDITDDVTFAIEWNRTHPRANALVDDELGPFPAHLLAESYQTDGDRFLGHPVFAQGFIGVGPYRLAEWERGSHLVLQAYDRFYAGRPKIDTITVRFLPHAPTALANLLAGSVDGVLPRTLDFTQAMFVKGEWERAGKKPVALAQPTHWRMLFVQLRPDVANPPEIVDVRTRRGLVHSLDRAAMVDTLLAGQAPVSDTFIPPDDVKWESVRPAVARYPYDTRRALELLGEVGWRRGTGGSMVNAAGERITIPLRTTAGAQYEQELAIIADYWQALGFAVDQMVLSQAQDADARFRTLQPAFDGSQIPVRLDTTLQRLNGANCPTEQTRWSGSNRGCWQNPAADRINDALATEINPPRQQELLRDFVGIVSSELPVLPLYFSVQVVLFREGVTGVKGDTRPSGSETWNVSEWDIIGVRLIP
jgi:peptide/nickel transport system substrate-binding protein